MRAIETNKFERIFLLPGHLVTSTQPKLVTTLLGSCVSVCLFNKRNRFGSMNHYMLPTTNSGVRSPKYGDYAIRSLIQFMYKNGGGLDDVAAMVFAGAVEALNLLRAKRRRR